MAVDTPVQRPNLVTQIKDLKRRIALLERVNQLGRSAIQEGALRILTAANKVAVRIGLSESGTERGIFVYDVDDSLNAKLTQDGLTVFDGGGIVIEDGGGIIVQDGGDLVVNDGGDIKSYHPDDSLAALFGTIRSDSGTGPIVGYGLLVQGDGDVSGHDILRARYDVDNDRVVYVGDSDPGGYIDELISYAGRTYFNANRIELNADGTSGGSPNWGLILSSGEQVFIETQNNGNIILEVSGSGEVFMHGYKTTSSGANVNVGGTTEGPLRRVTSARKYKTNIEDLSVSAEDVLALKPRVWQDKNELVSDPDSTNWHVGFIAEEMVDSGLSVFVNFDEDGEADSIAYDRLSAALVPVIQEQATKLDEQDARIAELELAVAQLVEKANPKGKAKGADVIEFNPPTDAQPLRKPATTTKPKRIP